MRKFNVIKIEWFDRGVDEMCFEEFNTVLEAVEFGKKLRERDALGEYLVGDLTPYIATEDGQVFELVPLY